MTPSKRGRWLVLAAGVTLLSLVAFVGLRMWWSAGEAADRANWQIVQSQTAWVPGHLSATPREVIEPCSQSLHLGAVTWTAEQGVTAQQIAQAQTRMVHDGWSQRSEDASSVVLTKEFDGRVAEVELVKPSRSIDGNAVASLMLPAKFCGL